MSKVYSRVDQLPRGLAGDNITKGCIVLEGGAFRGVYTTGVLDALMRHGINMECTVGVSAGALSGVNYVAGQIGRAARCNLTYRHDSRYTGHKGWRKSHGVIGFDFVFKDYNEIEPLNERRFYNKDRKFYVVATDCSTGEPVYFDRDSTSDIEQAIRASASMPVLSQMVLVEGKHCLDGGCSMNIPTEWALEQGFEHIIVVRTRESGYRKPGKNELQRVQSTMYRNFPKLKEKLLHHNSRYNAEMALTEKLHKKGRIFTICPSAPVTVGRLEPDMEKLGDLYHMGYKDGMNCLKELKKYLSGKVEIV